MQRAASAADTTWLTAAAGSATAPPACRVGGIPIFDGDMEAAVARCFDALDGGAGVRVATANLDFLASARTDGQLLTNLQQASLVTADGWPVVLLARLAGARRVRRVTGVDLVGELFGRSAERGGLRVAFYGSDPENAAAARERVESTYPGVRVVLAACPPYRALTPEEEAGDRQAITDADPDLVLVALGSPRQERVMTTWFDVAPSAIWIGVGGTLDFFSSRRVRAPRVVQRAGLEWAFRFAQEPGRLWRRYLLRDAPALARLLPASAWQRVRAPSGGADSPATPRQRVVDRASTDFRSTPDAAAGAERKGIAS